MSLDPQFAELIAKARAAGSPPVASMPVAEARLAYRERYRLRGPDPVDVARVEDLSVPGAAADVPCRLYVPNEASGASNPLLVYFHGGGFVVGDVEAYDAQSRVFAERTGCLIIAPDFRLAPEHPYPAATHDALAVVEWVRAHATELRADSRRIAVGGDSAGGNLAALVAQRLRGARVPIAAQLLLYPVTDFTAYTAGGNRYPSVEAFSSGFFLDRAAMEWFTNHYLPTRELAWEPDASPLMAQNLAGAAPALIVTAGYDPLRDMGKAYADRLQSAGVPVRYRCFEALVHNFLGFTKLIEAAYAASVEITGELAAMLRSGA